MSSSYPNILEPLSVSGIWQHNFYSVKHIWCFSFNLKGVQNTPWLVLCSHILRLLLKFSITGLLFLFCLVGTLKITDLDFSSCILVSHMDRSICTEVHLFCCDNVQPSKMKQLEIEVSINVNDSQTCNLQIHNFQVLTQRPRTCRDLLATSKDWLTESQFTPNIT